MLVGTGLTAVGVADRSDRATAAATVVEVRVAGGSDDAEERSGVVSLTSGDLELVVDSKVQAVGLRFSGLNIPPGASIAGAWVQFTTDEVKSASTNLTVRALAHDNAPTFTTRSRDVSSRARSAGSIPWTPVAWTTVGQAGVAQRTPDLSSLITEVTRRPGWRAGNALAFVITGTGTRTARAFESGPAALLHVEFDVGTTTTTTTTSPPTTVATTTTVAATTTSPPTTVATTTTTPPTTAPPTTVTGAGESNVLLALGDMTDCSKTTDDAVATMLRTEPGTIVMLGDLAYSQGSVENFARCFDPLYRDMMTRIRPAPGNHEYDYFGGVPYFDYFGATAGDPTRGYYSYEVNGWHILALNSNCSFVGGCAAGSPQEQWLRADLAAHPAACTLAYWHHPMFATGYAGNNSKAAALYQALYEFHAEIVLSGHSHTYERFAPQTATAVADPAHGIREFVVGTGGHSHYVKETTKPNSEVFDNTSFGALKLTLAANGYSWEFLRTSGELTDSGSASCHD